MTGSPQNEKKGMKNASAPQSIGDINWFPYSIATKTENVYKNIPKKYATLLKIMFINEATFWDGVVLETPWTAGALI
jgi:hypothetical protein